MGATRAMTYAALAAALGVEVESARRLSQRRRWPKHTADDGLARVEVPVDFLAARARQRVVHDGGDIRGDLGGDEAELIARVVARVRTDPGFADRLDALLADAAADPLADRLAEVERRLAALEGPKRFGTFAEQARAHDPVEPEVEHVPPVPVAEEPEAEEPVEEEHVVGEPLVVGEGRQRRLTPAGEAEVERRLAAGQGDAEIATAVGVARNAILNRRRRLAERED